MGLFSKIANIFYDEVEEEVKEESPRPLPKQEVKEVVKERPRIEEIKLRSEEEKKEVKEVTPSIASPIYSERNLFKTQENKTFRFPIMDEDDEEVEEKPKSRASIYSESNSVSLNERVKSPERTVERNSFNFSTPRRESKEEIKKTEAPKIFKPSPVISPVYGIQDKNYTKEEMMARREPLVINRDTTDMNYDSVRRKAYGTLEDELENTLTKITNNEEELSKTIEEVNKYSEEENNKSIEDLLNEIEVNKSMSVGEAEEMMKDAMEKEEYLDASSIDNKFEKILSKDEKVKEDKDEDDGFDKTLEHDLFNLIDSMYEEKDV